MSDECSRRSLIAGTIATIASTSPLAAQTADRSSAGCAINRPAALQRSYDGALCEELSRIRQTMPVNPGIQYLAGNDVYSHRMGSVRNSDGNITTVGTIYFGIGKIDKLMQRKEGGVAIAGILAHECAHIFQFYSTYEKRLEGPTRVLMELHADTLAGYYMAKRPDPRIEKLAIFAEALRDLGSYDSADEYFHGTPGQRHVALEKGYFLSKKGLSFTDAANEAANYVKTLLF